MAIKNKKMSLEDKISCLEKLSLNGIDFKKMPQDFISTDGIIVKNVIINLKRYYQKNQLTVKQMIACEKLGIEFPLKELNLEDKIHYLKKAKEEEISFSEITENSETYSCSSIYHYICDVRKAYYKKMLTKEQEAICMNDLKLILSNHDKKIIVMQKIREGALKNIILREEIQKRLV